MQYVSARARNAHAGLAVLGGSAAFAEAVFGV